MQPHLYLLGDATFDNLYARLSEPSVPKAISSEAQKTSVEGYLKTSLKDIAEVFNHAYDGFTLSEIFAQGEIGATLPRNASGRQLGTDKELYMSVKATSGNISTHHCTPLTDLNCSIKKKPETRHYVATCGGQAEFLAATKNLFTLCFKLPQLAGRYISLIQRIENLGENVFPILTTLPRIGRCKAPQDIYARFRNIGIAALSLQVLSLGLIPTAITLIALKVAILAPVIFLAVAICGLYLTHQILPLTHTHKVLAGKDSLDEVTYNAFVHKFNGPILSYAKQQNLPVLDLTHLFSNDEPEGLYSSCGLKPGQKGGELIAKALTEIVKSMRLQKTAPLQPGWLKLKRASVSSARVDNLNFFYLVKFPKSCKNPSLNPKKLP